MTHVTLIALTLLLAGCVTAPVEPLDAVDHVEREVNAAFVNP